MADRNPMHYHAALASAPRRQVLDTLLHSPVPLDATAVGNLLGLHVTTARFHLDQLAAVGLVHRRAGEEKRRGRPRMLYTPSGAVREEDAREQLIHVLATALARENDTIPVSISAGRRWGSAFETPDPANPVPGLIEVLDRLGFEPEPVGKEIRLLACPFREAARENPDVVCSVHRGLIDELMDPTGERAQLVPFVEPDLCLVIVGQ